MGNSFSSIRDTLAHILGAEWIWLERWQGRCPKPRPSWEAVEHDQMLFIEALTPQRLGEELSYINQNGQRNGQRNSYPLSHQLVHVVNPSSCHRGQVITCCANSARKPRARISSRISTRGQNLNGETVRYLHADECGSRFHYELLWIVWAPYKMPILCSNCVKRGSERSGSAMGSTPRYTRRSLRSW